MGKLWWRLGWILLALIIVPVAGSLIAAWFQIDVLKNLFTPLPLIIIALITVAAVILLAWKDLRDESFRSDDKRDLTREQRSRAAMLVKVRNFWVTGVLEKSLHGAALIELGKEYKPEAVHYPWSSVLQWPDQPDKSLPSGTKTVEVFDAVGGELLILGEPGSGKTTMLLDLARDLIARAEQDDKLPIPVVFSLSSWAEEHPPLADWLAEELNFRYDVPKKIAAAWVKADSVLPLLDGLDEVKLEHRAACMEAINQFRKEHGLLPAVVCSRIHDYEALNAQLRLRGAIVLQSLTRKQIDIYLQKASEQLASIRALLQHDVELQWLAKSPLMLNIIALAYRGMSVEAMPKFTTVEARREHLFATYVRRMFERRGINKRYTPQQVVHWLSWLARRLVEHNQPTFYLEQIQPGWLHQSQLKSYKIAIRIGMGLASGLGFILFTWQVGLNLSLVSGLIFGVVVGLAYELGEIITVETLDWSFTSAKTGFFIGLVGGLVGGLFVGSVAGLSVGLSAGLIGGLGGGLIGGLGIGLGGGLLFGLNVGEKTETKITPNQGIWRSAQNAVLSGLIYGLAFGPVIWLITGQFLGLFVGLLFGVFGVLIYGGLACIQHATLRLFLFGRGSIPLNYVRFLDYCAERIFLRKVGGGYIFVHRLLMEYFAGAGIAEALRSADGTEKP